MPLNVTKCSYMTNLGRNLNVEYNGEELPHTREVRMLGIRVAETMGHGPQIKHVTGSIETVRKIINGFGKYTNERGQGIIMDSFTGGLFNHGNAYDYYWEDNQYKFLQTKMNQILQKRSGWAAFHEAKRGQINDRTTRNRLLRIGNRVLDARRTGNGPTEILLPIYYLMKRNGQLTLMNKHRMNVMSRGAKLFCTARPHAEFDEAFRYLTDPILAPNRRLRRNMDFPYFRDILHQDERSIRRLMVQTQPTIFIQEFRRNRSYFGPMIGHKEMINKVKTFYKDRCQHAEWGRMACAGCGNAVDEWRSTQINTVRNETRQALERNQHLIMVNTLGEWQFKWVTDEEVRSDMILVDSLDDDTFIRPLQRIISNVPLLQLFDRLFNE